VLAPWITGSVTHDAGNSQHFRGLAVVRFEEDSRVHARGSFRNTGPEGVAPT